MACMAHDRSLGFSAACETLSLKTFDLAVILTFPPSPILLRPADPTGASVQVCRDFSFRSTCDA